MGMKENLAAIAERRNKAKERRSSILDAILQISAERAAAVPDAPPNSLSGMQRAVARRSGGGATAGPHSMNDGHGHKSQKAVNGMNADFANRLQRMIRDSGNRISIGSGYRSIAQQQVLYDRWVRRVPGQAPAAKPGKSNHNHGLAADLVYRKGASAWAHANAGKYGLHFPMSYEPWHIEPVSTQSQYKRYRKRR